ncbi:MAG: cob(I)yrinic acid a,c-diamide adenosyltransferase [Coriobacteriia bacterium]|nr:cob(I)yrinic acid a,c-diamide adenosyltransferase [Coriobacteriia bacterium]MCL2750292.1 cob(I)yrinic acid a,c-diamide adenosyltransferase [Coriobacteriia bacterium]
MGAIEGAAGGGLVEVSLAGESPAEGSLADAPSGLVHVYCGSGKGKTTAAIGLAVRSAGTGNKVLVAQFFKGRPSGELAVLATLPNVTVLRDESSNKFIWEMSEEEEASYLATQLALLEQAWSLAVEGNFDLLILDEVLYLPFYKSLNEQRLLEMLHARPPRLEVVLTGRESSAAIDAAANYVTKMENIKHPFNTGIPQRKGIEY